MTLRVDGVLPRNVYMDGVQSRGVYLDGDAVWLPTGYPVAPARFHCSPARLTIGSATQMSVVLENSQAGLTAASLVERLADGSTRTIDSTVSGLTTPAGSSESFPFPGGNPGQDATYTLRLTNVNGTAAFTAPFTWGRAPTVTSFTASQFHQGILGITPDSILLEWNVTGAVPAAFVSLATDNPAGFHFHPGYAQSGYYRYSRQGTHTPETVTLAASNVFGSVSATAAIRWP